MNFSYILLPASNCILPKILVHPTPIIRVSRVILFGCINIYNICLMMPAQPRPPADLARMVRAHPYFMPN
jgi:hypothetical protein